MLISVWLLFRTGFVAFADWSDVRLRPASILKNRFTNLTRRGIECFKRACPPVAFWIPLEKLSPLC